MGTQKKILVMLLVFVGLGLLLGGGLAGNSVSANRSQLPADPTETPMFNFLPIIQGGTDPTPNLSITDFIYEGSDEYVEITNSGTGAQVMTGWRIHSVVGDQWYAFPDGYVLAARAVVRVHSGTDAFSNPPADLLWGYAYVWLNEGDKAVLYDEGLQAVDEWCYGSGCP